MSDTYLIDPNKEMTFYVGFRDSRCCFWWQRLLKRGFQHCFHIAPSGNGCIYVEHHSQRIMTTYFDVDAETLAYAQLEGGIRMVEIKHKPDAKATYRFNMSCVSLIINAIGLQYILAFTPYALYCTLIKLGGIELRS